MARSRRTPAQAAASQRASAARRQRDAGSMTQAQARTLVKLVSESLTFLPRLQVIDDAVRVEYRKAVPQYAFDPEKAARMYRKLVDEVARAYLASIGTTATLTEMFPPAARDLASRMLVRDFLLYHVKD